MRDYRPPHSGGKKGFKGSPHVWQGRPQVPQITQGKGGGQAPPRGKGKSQDVKKGGNPYGHLLCAGCGKPGHFWRDCPLKHSQQERSYPAQRHISHTKGKSPPKKGSPLTSPAEAAARARPQQKGKGKSSGKSKGKSGRGKGQVRALDVEQEWTDTYEDEVYEDQEYEEEFQEAECNAAFVAEVKDHTL